MQTTMLKKKVSENTWDDIDPKELINNGVLQVEMTLEALRKGKVHKYSSKKEKISKKALEMMSNVDKNSRLYRLMGSAKRKILTKEEEEKLYEDYEHKDLSDIFRKHGLH